MPCISTHEKKLIKFWLILVILYVKGTFVLSHVVFNLTMEWIPRGLIIVTQYTLRPTQLRCSNILGHSIALISLSPLVSYSNCQGQWRSLALIILLLIFATTGPIKRTMQLEVRTCGQPCRYQNEYKTNNMHRWILEIGYGTLNVVGSCKQCEISSI